MSRARNIADTGDNNLDDIVVDGSGNVTATSFIGDGSALTGLSASAPPTTQLFTSSGTWTKPTDCQTIKVTVIGGGGGGGAASGQDETCNNAGGSGGGGGCAIKYIDVSAVSSVSVTIGSGGAGGSGVGGNGSTGGTSSFGAYCSATGGGGGTGVYSNGNVYRHGANGGDGSGGDINVRGGTGQDANSYWSGYMKNGTGGHSFFGGGGYWNVITSNTNITGASGVNGGGGAGGLNRNNTGNASGGAGGAGVVFVEEYY